MSVPETATAAAFEPRIVGFVCNWCSYRAADLAGTARIKYPPNVRLVRTMCSGRVDPAFILQAFARGADGVMLTGCHPGECHYLVQNHKALRRFALVRQTLRAFGIEDERLRLQWASAAEGAQLAAAVREMVDALRPLGPLRWPAAPAPIDRSSPHGPSAVRSPRDARPPVQA